MGNRVILFKSGESQIVCLFDAPIHGDLHAFALPRLKEIQQSKNVHFTPEGSKVLAGEVVRSIEAALAAKAE